MTDIEAARKLIRDIPDFPIPGVLFRDATPLLAHYEALGVVVEAMAQPWEGKIEAVVGMESRGFIFGSLLAQRLGVGFVPVRKPGKLPYKTESVSYGLEYGKDELQIHIDALEPGEKALICDDLIATGGTAHATRQLVERIGGTVVGYSFLIELVDLKGRERLEDTRVPIEVVYRM